VKNELRPYFLLILLVIVVDQLSKLYIRLTLVPGESRQILGDFLKFTFVYNPGGAFGISIGNFWAYTFISLLAVAVVIIYFLKVPDDDRFPKICLAVVVGGAIGNLIDRIAYGQVVDFIDVNVIDIVIRPFKILFYHFPGFSLYRWYIFNVADAAITLGLIGFIIYLLFQDKFVSPARADDNTEVIQNEQPDIKADSPGERGR
jgi:signal peptidase II